MEKKSPPSPSSSPSSPSSEHIESSDQAEAEAEAGAYKWYPCFLVDAVKSMILKCLGASSVQELCTCSSDPPQTITDPDPPAGDGGAVSFATPPRPGGSTGSGPQIN